MRKTLLVAFILLMTVTLLSGTISATSSENFTDLAGYFPADSTAFIGLRTDDGFIDEIDGLIQTLGNSIPEIAEEEINVRELLDLVTLFGGFGGTFDETIRPWLGDSVAIGLTDIGAYLTLEQTTNMMENGVDGATLPLIIAIESTDADEATAFWSTVLEIDPTEFDNFIVFDSPEMDVLIGEDVVLAGDMDSLIAAYTGDLSPLSDSEDFNTTLATLPHDNYSLLVYANLAGLMESVENMMDEMSEDDMMTDMGLDTTMLDGIIASPATFALGVALIDDRNLVMDIASLPMEDMVDMPGFSTQNAVDLTFAERIPANAQLVVMDNNFGAEFLGVFEVLSAMSPLVQGLLESSLTVDLGMGGDMGLDDPNMMAEGFLNALLSDDFDLGIEAENLLTELLMEYIGLNLRDDLLSWMEGDYATFISLVEVESDSELPIEVTFMTETTDGDATVTMIDAINVALVDNEVEIPPELNISFDTDGEVFAVGIGSGVEYALTGDGPSLADSDSFTYAQETLFLDDAISILFINVAPLAEVLPTLADIAGAGDAEMMSGVEQVLAVFDSLSLTATQADDGTAVIRFAITLSVE